MEIRFKSTAARVAAMAVEIAVVLVLTAWVVRNYWAGVIAQRTDAASLKAAARLAPGDYQYRLDLGRLYQYNVEDVDPAAAIRELTMATRMNPYDPQAWLDLSNALVLQGDTARAELCLQRADFLAPAIPSYQWAIGNYYLLHGQVGEAFHHFRRVLRATDNYTGTIYQTAWKASDDATEILNDLIPTDPGHEFGYLDYLLGNKQLPDAQQVWSKIESQSAAFDPAAAGPLIDALIGARKPDSALEVWSTLRNRLLIKPTYQPTAQNLVENGDFEEPPMNFGFDWRMFPIANGFVGLDDASYHSAGHSLLIRFPGAGNLDFHNVWQFVPVKISTSYQLTAFIKAAGITTDSGPRLEVRDAFDATQLDRSTDSITGSTPSWTLITLDFKTGPKTGLITAAIRRFPSEKLDNQIAGQLWVDDVTLKPAE